MTENVVSMPGVVSVYPHQVVESDVVEFMDMVLTAIKGNDVKPSKAIMIFYSDEGGLDVLQSSCSILEAHGMMKLAETKMVMDDMFGEEERAIIQIVLASDSLECWRFCLSD